MFTNLVVAVLARIDRWTGNRTRPQRRRMPLLPVLGVVAGCALTAGYLHTHRWSTLVLGGIVVLSSIMWLTQRLDDPVDAGYQRAMIAQTYLLALDLPRGVVLTDPATGEQVQAQYRRGFFTLVVSDSVAVDDGAEPIVRRYLLALLGVPSPAPLLCHVERAGEQMTWGAFNQALDVAGKTDAMKANTAELEQLLGQVERLAAATRAAA